MKLLGTVFVAGIALTTWQPVMAQYTVEKGKTIPIEITVNSETPCNIRVNQGNEKTDVKVNPKTNSGVYEFTGRVVGEQTLNWRGKIKFRGLKSLGPCQGSGAFKVVTTESAEAIEAAKQAQKAREKAEEAKAELDAQTARIEELEAKLKAAETIAQKTPEQKAEEARIVAEARAYAKAKAAADAKAAAEARAAAQEKAAEDKAKSDLMRHVFSKRWEVQGMPCTLNGGTYQVFSDRLKIGWNMAAGGKLVAETGNRANFSFEVLNGNAFRHVTTIYSGGNKLVTGQLRNPNARVSYSVNEYTLIDKNTMRKTVLDQRQMNFDLMLKGIYREEYGPDKGKVQTIKACQ